jgi:hypothetical protein
MTPQVFIAKWQKVNPSERSACQQHFLDLCELLGQEKPAAADPEGQWYTFEKGVKKTEGGDGWADVWMRGHFAWEYKRKHKDLKAAYSQLLLYREDLENPPLLVVCDMDRFQVHTNFTATAKRTYEFDLAGLAEPANFDILRKLFEDPEALRPGITNEAVTVEAARRFGDLADAMRQKGIEPLRAAHFLMKLMFCMFGQDVGLLPAGLFDRLLDDGKAMPASLNRRLQSLFAAMEKGGDFGPVEIPWFNGGLFADNDVIPLTTQEINTLIKANEYDWASVEPSIFGTLFERTLDPGKRSQIGAHYTSRADIETLLKPVLVAPLRREWDEVKRKCEEQLWPKLIKASRARSNAAKPKDSPQRKKFDRAILDFAERLHYVTVLDPACGSGNFLYVAIHMLLDLEREVIAYAASRGLSLVPHVSPSQLHGLEINPYAQQLAQVVIWIGYLQWMHYNGFREPRDPILQPIDNIRCQDAILDLSDPEHPKEPEWPQSEFIVGNPPFLGNRLMTAHLGQAYVESLSKVYEERLGGRPDLCCYWFEKGRSEIERGKCRRVGLLATQAIRGGTNRNVLRQIKENGDIFFAESDRPWILEGANVHVSMIGFDDGQERTRCLDGEEVLTINANLTTNANVTSAHALPANVNLSFQGCIKRGSFDIDESAAMGFLTQPGNPGGRPNSDVVVPYLNGMDVTRRNRNIWIVHFGDGVPMKEASYYSAPFEHARLRVYPERQTANQSKARDEWWLHWCTRPQMNKALAHLSRFIATPRVAKHRVFTWLESPSYADCQLVVFASDDDYFFGVLHSRVHEVWARAQGTQVRERESGFRYTPKSCFETFPLPKPTSVQMATIAEAAKKLNELRNSWLNPAEWTMTQTLEFPGSVNGPWARYVFKPNANGVGTVRWPRVVPKDAECAAKLKQRTLTSLYNHRFTWLDIAHRDLDEAVLAAYGWRPQLSDELLLEKLLILNTGRRAESSSLGSPDHKTELGCPHGDYHIYGSIPG